MKFKTTEATASKEILANDHYVAVPYDCSEVTDDNGVVKAGTIVPSNDNKAVGVLLYDVSKNDNPNGAVVIHGSINKNKLPTAPEATAVAALKGIMFLPIDGSE